MPDIGHVIHVIGAAALTWLPLVFFGLICYLLWRTVQMMPRVKPTQLRPDSSASVSWTDVAGAEEAKAELLEVVDFLRHPKRFERLGARVPKGILLYGPPGTGKTLLAKAIAHESGASFYSQSASAFVEMFAGRGEILRVHTRSKPLAADVDLSQIARQTAGLTGADLANIVNEAAIFAGRREAQYITARDFDNAIDRVVGGLQQRKVLTEKERRILAYHEAGHAPMSNPMGSPPPRPK